MQVEKWFVEKAFRTDAVTGSTKLTSSVAKAGLKLLKTDSEVLTDLQNTIEEFSAAISCGDAPAPSSHPRPVELFRTEFSAKMYE